MDNFNRVSRFARYIIQYTVWIFSKWHHNRKGNLFSKEYITKFASDKFQISNGHNYPEKIPRYLDDNLSGVMNDGKIIVSNTEIRNRLIYALQIKIRQNMKDVLNYYSRLYIKNYYEDVTDFDSQDNYIILFGLQAVLNWAKSYIPFYTLHDRIIHPIEEIKKDENDKEIEIKITDEEVNIYDKSNIETIISPYFLSLDILGKTIYLVQQASSIGNALYISRVWFNEGYNPGLGDIQASLSLPYTYISYNGPYPQDGTIVEQADSDYVVLQYKYANMVYTMALLKFM
jgi:hypothetical protein